MAKESGGLGMKLIGGTVAAGALASLVYFFKGKGDEKKLSPQEVFVQAIETWNVAELNNFITSEQNAKLVKGFRDEEGNTILHLVSKNGTTKLMLGMKDYGLFEFAVRIRNLKACAPIHLASPVGPLENVELLLQASGDELVNWSCFQGWTPLLLAASKGHTDIVQALIERGANVSHKNADGHTALMIASFNGYLDMVKLLVSHGVDIYTMSNKAENALFLASVKGNTEIVKFLLETEKSIPDSSAVHEKLVDTMAFNGGTPLHAASEGGFLELVELLLRNGASVDAMDISNSTPLHLAASVESIEVVRLLAKTSNLNAPNSFGSTPLHDAVFQGKIELAKALLESGASLAVPDHDGLLPIHSACRSASSNAHEVLELLIKHGSDINSRDSTGRTPLQMCAVKEERGFELAKILLEKGADFTIENDQGWNALHVALSEYGYKPTATLITDHARTHNPQALADFSPEKPRRARDYDRPAKFCSLTDEQQKAVFDGVAPSLDAVARLISENRVHKVVVLTGAGISVNAGIPDFRNPKTGIYSRATTSKYGLPSGPAVFDVGMFYQNPNAIYDLANDIFFPAIKGRVKPTAAHKFIKHLHDKGILLRNFSQNVDGLENVVGLPEESIVEVHGSFSKYNCVVCNAEYSLNDVQVFLSCGQIPLCKCCNGLIKPGIVFFGDPLPGSFYERFIKDLRDCDMLIIMGTSLKVYPFASLVNLVGDNVPRILFNLDEVGPFEGVMESKWNYRDVSVTGDCDVGVKKLADLLGWQL